MNIKFNIKNSNKLEILFFIKGRRYPIKSSLTISQDLDILLIEALDKIIGKNTIERLSLKSIEIGGKMEQSALSGMIMGSVAKALSV